MVVVVQTIPFAASDLYVACDAHYGLVLGPAHLFPYPVTHSLQELAAQAAAAEALRAELATAGEAAAGKDEEVKKFKLQVCGWQGSPSRAFPASTAVGGRVWCWPLRSSGAARDRSCGSEAARQRHIASSMCPTSLQLVKAKKLRAADGERCAWGLECHGWWGCACA